ncbi:flavodoxin domain-containing protein [Dysosmobacter sp.]|uniref:flavodoxin domain-containing protein n=1 Tax=Dysosmobacter sp. TaxID=2591382 RepID=UPI002A84D1CB|nr:flavodoxin domain-containing protein [Dysosmobacter sp.]MDY3282179.1 flavodoxin domain-containing protein [Dysosmobacter sp.]
MEYLVTYASKYGSTERYARWIAAALDCPCKEVREVREEDLARCGVLIHGGGLYAGGLSGIRVVTDHAAALAGKPVVVFSCGLADPADPVNAERIEAGVSRALGPELSARVRQFHLRGAIDYQRLNPLHRAMMAMLRKSALKKGYENLRDEDRLMVDTYGRRVDFTDEASIAPLLAYIRSL